MLGKNKESTKKSRTARCTAHRNQGSTGFRRINQGFQRKKQGSDGKTGEQETTQKRRHTEENIDNKTVVFTKLGGWFVKIK